MPLAVFVSAPLPVRALSSSSVVEGAVWNVPPPALRVIARGVVMLAVVMSVPLSRVRPVPAAPRLASLEIAMAPPTICVPPV